LVDRQITVVPAVDAPSLARSSAVKRTLSPSMMVSRVGARVTRTVGVGAAPPSPAHAADESNSAARAVRGAARRSAVHAAVRAAVGAEAPSGAADGGRDV